MGKIRFVYKIQLLLAVLSMVLLSSGCGSSSSSSTPAPADTTAPSAPTYLTAATASDIKVSLRWLPSTDSVGVKAYTITRNGLQIKTTTTATTVYSDPTCSASTVYTYTVVAIDAAGNTSAPSSSATTTTLAANTLVGGAPTTPGTLSATASSNKITLTWGASTANWGVSGYNIYRSASSLGSYAKIGTTTTTTYTDSGLTAGTKYYYVVKAFDGVFTESGASNETFATTP